MKSLFWKFSALAFATVIAGCSSSSGSSGSDSDGKDYDCSLDEDGVKVFAPEGGETFHLGDSVEVTFVAKYKNAGSFKVTLRTADGNVSLFDTSVGEEAPDGTHCTTVKAYLNPETVPVADSAVVHVEAYNAARIRGDSEAFSIRE